MRVTHVVYIVGGVVNVVTDDTIRSIWEREIVEIKKIGNSLFFILYIA